MTIVVFSLVRIMTGKVVLTQLSEAPGFRPDDVEAPREQLGLNESWLIQYGRWLGGVFHGDLGKSLWSDKDVKGMIIGRVPITIELAIRAFVMANIVVLTVGVLSATGRSSSIRSLTT